MIKKTNCTIYKKKNSTAEALHMFRLCPLELAHKMQEAGNVKESK